MSDQDKARHRRPHSAEHRRAVSRRQLLAAGAATAIATLPPLASATPRTHAVDGGGARRAHVTDEQRRLVEILDRHGPELGSRR